MKKYIIVLFLGLVTSLQAEVRVGTTVIWGTRYERASAFVDKLKRQYPRQFDLLDKIADGKKLNSQEEVEINEFSKILKKRMDRFDLFEDIRPYIFWFSILLLIVFGLFGIQRLVRLRPE